MSKNNKNTLIQEIQITAYHNHHKVNHLTIEQIVEVNHHNNNNFQFNNNFCQLQNSHKTKNPNCHPSQVNNPYPYQTNKTFNKNSELIIQ